jgi:hypothetical protein
MSAKGGTDDEFEFREEDLADEYLWQATEALLASGERSKLYPRRRAADADDAQGLILRRLEAANRRLEFSRTAILFINLFLAETLTRKEVDALDRLKPPDKFIVGSQLALGEKRLQHDRAPMGEIIRLFKLRNRLVHPKVRRVKVRRRQLFDRPGYEDFNPEAAARFITTVASTVSMLWKACDLPKEPPSLAARISADVSVLNDYGRLVRENLPTPPSRKVRRSLRSPVGDRTPRPTSPTRYVPAYRRTDRGQ